MSPHKNLASVASKKIDVSSKAFAFFRRIYPQKMHENVAADIGCSPATLRKMEDRGSAPSLPMFCRMVDAYGPSFLLAVTGWKWLDANVREAKTAALKSQIEQMQAELASIENR